MAQAGNNQNIELDMTPMIDVVFLLLVFFMVVSQVSKLDVTELSLPYAAKADESVTAKSELVVNIQQDKKSGMGNVFIQGKQFSGKSLGAFLCQNATHKGYDSEGRSRLHVFLRADQNIPTHDVQKVLGTLSDNKVFRMEVGASLTPEKKSPSISTRK